MWKLISPSLAFSFHFLDIFYFSTKKIYTLKTCTYEIIKIKISKKERFLKKKKERKKRKEKPPIV